MESKSLKSENQNLKEKYYQLENDHQQIKELLRSDSGSDLMRKYQNLRGTMRQSIIKTGFGRNTLRATSANAMSRLSQVYEESKELNDDLEQKYLTMIQNIIAQLNP